jgi:hypothetical protein
MLEVMIAAAPIREPLSPQHRRARIVLIALVVSLCFAALAARPRLASAEGVHFDPNSPAGKEYALPLDQARNEASGNAGAEGTGGSREASGESAALFGAGVPGDPAPGSQGAGEHGTGRHGSGGSDAGGGAAPAQPEPGGHSDTGGIRAISAGGDSYSWTTGAGLVLAILVLGGLLGLGLRGLQRTRSA